MKQIKTFILIILTTFSATIEAQVVQFEWARELIGAYEDGGACGMGTVVACDNVGRAYAAGGFGNTLVLEDTTLYVQTSAFQYNSNPFVAKFETSGDLIWADRQGGTDTTYGGSTNAVYRDQINSIDFDADNNFYVCGNFEGSINFGNNDTTFHSVGYADKLDVFVAKFDSSGQFIWADHINAYNIAYQNECGMDIDVSPTGDILVTGYFYGTCYFDQTPFTAQNTNAEAFVAKYNTNGDLQWLRKATGAYTSELSTASFDSEGNVNWAFKFWNTASVGNVTFSATYSLEVGIVQFDSSGSINWTNQISGASAVEVFDLICDDSNNVYIGGRFTDSVEFNNVSYVNLPNEDWDTYLVKYNSSGTEMWAKHIHTRNAFIWNLDAFGKNIYVAGSFWDTLYIGNEALLDNYGSWGNDGYILCLDADSGQALWAKQMGTANGNMEEAFDVELDYAGNIYTTGYLLGGVAYLDNETLNHYSNRAYIAKIGLHITQVITGIDPCDSISGSIEIMAQGGAPSLQYSIDGGTNYYSSNIFSGLSAGNYTVKVMDSTGQVVEQQVSIIFNIVPETNLQPVEICQGDSALILGTMQFQEALYHDTLVSSLGCDSVINQQLTVLELSYDSIEISSCDSYLSPSGNHLWAVSGVYSDTLLAANQCDSILTIDLNIIDVDTTVSVLDSTLTSNQSAASYQWIDCDSMQVLTGDTAQTYVNSSGGSFALALSYNGCLDTSECTQLIPVGIRDWENNSHQIDVFPNPMTDVLTVKMDKPYPEMEIILSNAYQTVFQESYNAANYVEIQMSHLASGPYYLWVRMGDFVLTKKVIKLK